MQRALKDSRKEVARLEKKLQEQVEKSNGQLASAKMEVEKTKTALVEYKSRLAQAEDSLASATRERDQFKAKAAAPEQHFEKLSNRITQLESEKRHSKKKTIASLRNSIAPLPTSKARKPP